MLETIHAAYALIDQLHLTMTGIVAGCAVLTLAFLFAVREAAAWFFKVDDVKRDVRRVKDLVLELEGEIKVLQELLSQAKRMNAGEPAIAEEARLVKVRSTIDVKKPKAKSGGFPITH
jgi:hypothetical protein